MFLCAKSTYPKMLNGKMVRENALWRSLYSRCYGELCQRTYYDVTMSANFRDYSFFYEWCNNQIGFDRKHENGRYWNLDKDLICIGNRKYHEDFCAFVPTEVNTVLNCPTSNKSGVVGVIVLKGKYAINIKDKDGYTKQMFFSRREAAYNAYKEHKELKLRFLADKWEGQIDSRVIHTLRTYNLPTYDILYGEDVL